IQIMFEFTDNKPGFLIDEPLETLGQKLSLPHYLEMFRKEIQASLPLLITN
ncbi:MAG: ring-cleaving dioxygenase, partial [Erysipelothrix sp.]|nr:ring-cleaving dioxygenase [Erysipelothrix sp.]